MPSPKQINQLSILSKSAPAANQSKIQNIIDLFITRKIPMFSTAFNIVRLLASSHKATIRSGKAIRLYYDILAKYAPQFTITKSDPNNPESYIQFDFTDDHKLPSDSDMPDERSFDQIFITLGERPEEEIAKVLSTNSTMKIILKLGIEIRKEIVNSFATDPDSDIIGEIIEEQDKIFDSKKMVIKNNTPYSLNKSNYKKVLDLLKNDLASQEDEIGERVEGSGWTLYRYLYFTIDIFKIRPIRASSYIPTPEKYANAKCGLINIKNEDQQCFKWCMKYHQTKKEKMMIACQCCIRSKINMIIHVLRSLLVMKILKNLKI